MTFPAFLSRERIFPTEPLSAPEITVTMSPVFRPVAIHTLQNERGGEYTARLNAEAVAMVQRAQMRRRNMGE
eukprot:CAMPEP_0113230822 /NCGR_PEP_ID=MMETSP0008_2-20120614/1093_1 /TAXON_ID=97485 /ORGANISM="Prymnesium parvum" /LENGTH=71 /DNA_ID=CAMNT_0000077439 /DNA_START=408 /DNA_END=620 /DNA_ORIENTATION=- /assembly_acc=CAM_ASM_000153